MTDKMIMIPLEEYKQMVKDQKVLNALQSGGVDNWEHFDDSMQELWESGELD